MIRVIISNRILIEKDRLRLIKRYSMLPLIFAALTLIPFEANAIHTYIVRIMLPNVNIRVSSGNAVPEMKPHGPPYRPALNLAWYRTGRRSRPSLPAVRQGRGRHPVSLFLRTLQFSRSPCFILEKCKDFSQKPHKNSCKYKSLAKKPSGMKFALTSIRKEQTRCWDFDRSCRLDSVDCC
jgi:hypothetical protein